MGDCAQEMPEFGIMKCRISVPNVKAFETTTQLCLRIVFVSQMWLKETLTLTVAAWLYRVWFCWIRI